MTRPDPEAERGYREQLAELQLDDTTSPRARHVLEQHQAILQDTPFNRGRLAATADYIRAQEPDSGPWAEGNYGPHADPLPPDLADSMASWAAAPAARPAAETYGPCPPTAQELLAARNAPALAVEAGCEVDEYERLVLAKLETEAAFQEAEARAQALPEPDPDPEVGGWPGWSDRSMLAPDPEPEIEP